MRYAPHVRNFVSVIVSPYEAGQRSILSPKNYIGKKASQILEQHNNGAPALQIARSLEISAMTVYRHLERAGLRRVGDELPK